MNRAAIIYTTLMALSVGCNADVGVGDRDDAAISLDAFVPIDVDTGVDAGSDAGSGVCDVGTTRCSTTGRDVCVFVAGATAWQPSPCRDGAICDGDGLCVDAVGRDLAATISAPSWAHPDVGLTAGSSVSLGADRFPFGLVLANPFAGSVSATISGGGMPSRETIAGRTSIATRLVWATKLAQPPDTGAAPTVPISAWEPAIELGFLATDGVPVAAWLMSPGDALTPLDALCGGASPAPDCFTRSYEGTLVSADQGTRFVIGDLPAAAYYDACEDEIVVRGVPFVGITNLGGTTTVSVATTARTSASEPPTVPIAETDTPGAAEPGETLVAGLHRGGAWQLVVTPPRTLEECVPAAEPGCIRPCTSRALDLSGTTVTATGRVTVVAGHTCASDTPLGACGYAIESMPPTAALGSVHHVPGPASFEEAIFVHVVAVEDDTVVTTDTGTATLAAGEGAIFARATDLVIEASAPLVVTRYSRRSAGGFASVVVLDDAARARQHILPVLAGAHALVVMAAADTVAVDGVPVTPTTRPFAGAPDLVVADLALDGARRLETEGPSLVIVASVPEGTNVLAVMRGARL